MIRKIVIDMKIDIIESFNFAKLQRCYNKYVLDNVVLVDKSSRTLSRKWNLLRDPPKCQL